LLQVPSQSYLSLYDHSSHTDNSSDILMSYALLAITHSIAKFTQHAGLNTRRLWLGYTSVKRDKVLGGTSAEYQTKPTQVQLQIIHYNYVYVSL